MTEFETIMGANCKPPKTRRKPPLEAAELSFLEKVRDVRMSLQNGVQTLVVVSHNRPFEKVFGNYSPVMKLYATKATLLIKTIDEVTAEDIESSKIIELDKE